jgi:GT2 family glycosyltransferase
MKLRGRLFFSRLRDVFGRSAASRLKGEDKFAAFLPDRTVAPFRPREIHTAVTHQLLPRHESLCEKPVVSVVLGSLNRVDFLKLAIDSVRAEVAGMNAEIIVVDGGSTDGAIEWLVKQTDVVAIVQNNRFVSDGLQMRRKSWGAFMNIGFRAAASPQVLMISDDCLLAPGSVSAALMRIRDAEAAGLKVGACAFYFRNWPDEDRYYVQRTIGGNLMVNHGLYAKEALEAAGYANEDDYVFYKADTDLSLRIWRAGYAIIDSPDSICEHYVAVNEAVRTSNSAVMEYDRQQMRRVWSELVDKAGVDKMGKIYLDTPPGRLAELSWRPLKPDGRASSGPARRTSDKS